MTTFAVVGFIFLFTVVGGAPPYLKEQFGWFIHTDDFGPRAVVAGPDGYVVVGDDADGNALVWRSPDGFVWERVQKSDALKRLDVGDVITTPSGLILVASDAKNGSVVTLISDEGKAWTRSGTFDFDGRPVAAAESAGHLSFVGDSYNNDSLFVHGSSAGELFLAEPKARSNAWREPVQVVASGSGFLAAVNHRSDAAIFISGDGTEWVEDLRFEDAEFVSLAGYQSGFIAVGRDHSADSPAVWLTNDGKNWIRNPLPPDSDDAEFDLVVAGRSELLLIGHRDSDETALWRSIDGETWESIPPPFGDAVIRDAVIGDSGAVVVGVDRALGATALWTRNESAAWIRVPHDEILFKVK